ncbi:uncharacterized protein Z519_06267 [Cladophialophora bantiana CBS 173.52]|uniref:Uncharacterized protein n=1 Tax=Cladophialophora bantiana (strain ATCC 10958 / CBS 173.52 / CDC B-1940 / NIH 8579) TaxID=1442370 RepID=A0A0D2G4V3_CLAB1|nr:uncharacterized protein Z519_06267 [Cladophialophora bantiana CBS 173.52]KIW93662.1 hypothetical protein Z519_06267 [Cladophialophora bantiana CBS 173.52]
MFKNALEKFTKCTNIPPIATSNNQRGSTNAHRYEWKAQITTAVQHLHGRTIMIGGRLDLGSPWYYINEYTIHPDRLAESEKPPKPEESQATTFKADNTWLMLEGYCTLYLTENQQGTQGIEVFEKQKAKDWAAVEKLFQHGEAVFG